MLHVFLLAWQRGGIAQRHMTNLCTIYFHSVKLSNCREFSLLHSISSLRFVRQQFFCFDVFCAAEFLLIFLQLPHEQHHERAQRKNNWQDVEAVEAYGSDAPLVSNTEMFNNLIGWCLGKVKESPRDTFRVRCSGLRLMFLLSQS